ncbi:hypothetical protein [Roseateles sp.]|uniref:hypothetical protein n=1 Tax=Roseateles sp. TaxID=1971397 RepID=UPI003267D23A
MKSISRVVSGLALAGLLPAAQADSFASAELSSVTLTLFDLDVSDGITPWIKFQDNTDQTYRGIVFIMSNNETVGRSSVQSSKAFASFARQLSSAGVSASSSFTVDATTRMGGTHLAQTSAAFEADNHLAWAEAYGALNQFTISDRSLLVVTATSVLSTKVTHSWLGSGEYQPEMASAATRIQLSGPDVGGTGHQLTDLGSEMYLQSQKTWDEAVGAYLFSPDSRERSSSLSGSFTNLSGAPMSGTLDMYVSVTSRTPSATSAVPEPQSISLALIGLLGLSGGLRLRRC